MNASLRARFDSQLRSAPLRTRVLWAVVAAAGLVPSMDTLILNLSVDPLADIHAYYDAVTRLNTGAPLYPLTANPNAPVFFRYPPLLAILFLPLALLPIPAAVVAWDVLYRRRSP